MACGSAALLAVLALACGGSTSVVSPEGGARCQMSLALPSPLPAAAGQTAVQLSSARDCAWSARSLEPWLQVEPASGQGDGTLVLSTAENPQGRSRAAVLDINGQAFRVTQDGAPCRFELTPTTVAVRHVGGRIQVQLTTLEGCPWTTQSSQPWVRVVSGSGGESSSTLEVAVDSNTGPERSALLSVATLLLAVTQEAGPNDRNECGFSIGPGSALIPAAGGTGSFNVSTRAGCAWGASSSQSWLVVVSSVNGTGPATVHYRVDPNPSPSARSAAITVGTRRHVVTQEGFRPE